MIEICRSTPIDLPIIVSLIEQLADYEKLRHECVITEEKLKKYLFGEHKLIHCLIAEVESPSAVANAADAGGSGKTPVGFALYFFNFSTFLGKPGMYLEDLFVLPEQRGSGIGQALFLKLAQIAAETGCGRLEWSVLNWNEPAIGFYQRLGAVPLSEWTVYRLTGENLDRIAALNHENG